MLNTFRKIFNNTSKKESEESYKFSATAEEIIAMADNEANENPEHAVIVSFGHDNGSNLESLFELEAQLDNAISENSIGEYDGNEISSDGKNGTLYMYGKDADSLFSVVKPFLEKATFLNNIKAVLRYGPPEDGVKETQIIIG